MCRISQVLVEMVCILGSAAVTRDTQLMVICRAALKMIQPATQNVASSSLVFSFLRDGKGGNQNHAIISTSGNFIRSLMPITRLISNRCRCYLACWESSEDTVLLHGKRRKIVGHPEHITIDVGSVREFAAEAETAFGTILLRVYRLLGGEAALWPSRYDEQLLHHATGWRAHEH